MRWALLFKTSDATRHWTRIPFYGKWCWASFSTFSSLRAAETHLETYLNRMYEDVEYAIIPTDLLRAPGR